MGLRDISIPKKTVQVGEQSFDVRGLSYEDVAVAVQTHGDGAKELFDHVVEKAKEGDKLDTDAIRGMVADALKRFPKLVSALAAQAADEPDMADTFAKLPFPKQVEALEGVIGLTFTSEAELKKLVETAIRGLGTVTSVLANLNSSPSKDGLGVSDET